VLPVSEETVLFVSGLLATERRRGGTRSRRRALGCYRQAVLVLRWFLNGTRLAQLAGDNRIGRSTAYRYLHEGIDVLAAAAPGLRGALLAARAAGHAHVPVDGTLIRTDRCHVPGPTARTDRSGRQVDLWWSGKHAAHGGNIQVIAAPDGWPLWTSPVRPGREHDTTALRAHTEALPLLAEWTDEAHAVLADLGYEGERAALTTPIKKTTDAPLTDDQRTINLLHAATEPRPNAGTPCSRPPSRRCAGSASVRGASARSPPPLSCCSTVSTAAPHDQQVPKPLLGMAQSPPRPDSAAMARDCTPAFSRPVSA
jgi:hypothetical protein